MYIGNQTVSGPYRDFHIFIEYIIGVDGYQQRCQHSSKYVFCVFNIFFDKI